MIPLTRPYFRHEETQAVQEVLASGHVSQGAKCVEFERSVAEYVGVAHAIAVSSCTAALHLSLLALGIGPGHRVAVPAFTFPAASHAVRLVGAELVFIDIDSDTYNMNLNLLEHHLREFPGFVSAVIPVHLFGQMLDMDRLISIAQEHAVSVIEDAACALGSIWYGGRHGRKAGTFGRLGCFSFHGRKIVTTGEGGMVVTDSAGLAEKVRRASTFGRDGDHFPEVGYNYKMSDINATIGTVQMQRINLIIQERKRLASVWDGALKGVKDVVPPYRTPGASHTFQSYVVPVRTATGRDHIIEALAEIGYEAQPGTYAAHLQPAYNYKGKCPKAVRAAKCTVSLPLYMGLGEDTIRSMAERIKEVMK